MAKRGDNIRKRNDGRWEGRVKIGSYPNGKTRYHSLYGKSYTEVRERMNRFVLNDDTADTAQASCETLEEVLEYWMKNSNLNRKSSSVHKYRYIIERHILPCIGQISVTALSSTLLNAFLTEKLKNGRLDGGGALSSSYVRTMALILQSSLDFCIKEHQCPDRKIHIAKPTVPKSEVMVLSRESQRVLEEEIRRHIDGTKLGVILSLQAGLRIGEICALTWDEVDFSRGIIHLRHTVSRVPVGPGQSRKTKWIIDTPKTVASVRDIPIFSGLMPFLTEVKKNASSSYVISEKASFVSPRTYEYRYHQLLRQCGIPAINYHALRHTFATRCVEAGVDIKTLSEILGHSDTAITLNTYVHSSWETKCIQLEKLSTLSL